MNSDFITHEQLEHRLIEFRTEILVKIFQPLKEIKGIKTVEDATGGDEPGIAPRKGKKFAGKKHDLRLRVDKNLYDALFQDAQENYGGNVSRCLDVILWKYYGPRPLSWETESEKE